MLYDPDQFSDKPAEAAELDKLLAKLMDCDLGEWDQDFVDDMAKRLKKYEGNLTVTPRQWDQLQRMEKQYL